MHGLGGPPWTWHEVGLIANADAFPENLKRLTTSTLGEKPLPPGKAFLLWFSMLDMLVADADLVALGDLVMERKGWVYPAGTKEHFMDALHRRLADNAQKRQLERYRRDAWERAKAAALPSPEVRQARDEQRAKASMRPNPRICEPTQGATSPAVASENASAAILSGDSAAVTPPSQVVRKGRPHSGLRQRIREALQLADGHRLTLTELAKALGVDRDAARKGANDVVRADPKEFGRADTDDDSIYTMKTRGAK